MDANLLSICGEESFGQGSNAIREKDGLWSVLCWLSILANANLESLGTFVGVGDVLMLHWKKYGRNYFSRYDFEEVDSESAKKVMNHLSGLISTLAGQTFGSYMVKKSDDYEYTDPIDKVTTSHQVDIYIEPLTIQGIRIIFDDGSRIIFRLSGTGSQGATIRVYVEKYDKVNIAHKTEDAVRELIKIALDVSRLEEFTGRKTPTVITQSI